MNEQKDIMNSEDVKLLVNSFYDKVRNDELLAPVFSKRIPDANAWPYHLGIMCNFWETVLFAKEAYRGNPFPKHIGLSIASTHFDRWIELFHKTIDTYFAGPKAQEAKDRAVKMRRLFEIKLSQAGEDPLKHLV